TPDTASRTSVVEPRHAQTHPLSSVHQLYIGPRQHNHAPCRCEARRTEGGCLYVQHGTDPERVRWRPSALVARENRGGLGAPRPVKRGGDRKRVRADGCDGLPMAAKHALAGGTQPGSDRSGRVDMGPALSPDYRLFLQRLHTLDRPLLCPAWRAEVGAAEAHLAYIPVGHEHGFQEGFLVLVEEQHFTNWLDDGAVGAAFMQVERAVFPGHEAGDNGSPALPERWPTAWGADPGTLDARRARLGALFATAPRLIPVMTGHYVLAEPSRAGNPV